MNLFLIGYRCTGKTSVGRGLAEKLEMKFVDADERLVQLEGMSIAATVAARGWNYFRRREKEILRAICREDAQVVATGGGVVLDPANVAAMKASGTLIWLQAGPETIRSRMLADDCTGEQRPALTQRGLQAEIEATLKERTPYYRAAMDFSVITDGRRFDEICDAISRRLD